MSVIRAFIAIELIPEILEQLDRISKEIRQKSGTHAVRWVPAANIHLTLKFLGDVSVNNLALLTDALSTEVKLHPRFTISIGGLGAYPKVRTPRVVWVGVEGPEPLYTLQRSIEMQMERLGYERDPRDFSPHLTLGRVSRSARPDEIHRVSEALEDYKVGFIGLNPVNEVRLYQSDLRPQGAIYSPIVSAPLAEVIP